MRARLTFGVAASALALAASGCGSSSSKSATTKSSTPTASGGATINGAGSTFAAPIYQQWGSQLASQGVTVNYQAIGSGAGVAQFTQGTVNFAGTDPALKTSEITALTKGKPVHVPTALGAITASYDLPGVKTGLKLDGKTLADIFLGKVTHWNAPEITKLNPGLKPPPLAITVVHRSDSSGTTKGFTTFLAAYSPPWKAKVGADKTVNWPTGTGGKGNSGVAQAIKQTPGAIGYVEQAYALQNNFTFASVKNKAGLYVAPTLASTSAAAAGIKVPADLRFSAINSSSPRAYPIVSQTFIVVYKDLCKGGMSASQAKSMVTFLRYGVGAAGQSAARQLSYAPLPASLSGPARKAVASLRCNGAPVGA